MITSHHKRQYAGENYELTCVVIGGESDMQSSFSSQWLKNGFIQKEETSGTLSFNPLRQTAPSSDGEYTCEVMMNGRRFSSETFVITVQGIFSHLLIRGNYFLIVGPVNQY